MTPRRIMITNADRRGIAVALAASTRSTFGRVKIGAALYDKAGRLVGSGCNQRRTHPRQYHANSRANKQIEQPCLHAEVAALMSVHAGHVPSVMYVARLDRNGKLANCKPCAACAMELASSGVKRVVFTTESGVTSYDVSNP